MNRSPQTILVLLMFLLFSPLSHAADVLMCGGAQVVEAELNGSGDTPGLREIWHWRPEESHGLPVSMMRKFITTDDCKPVSNNREILITSSGDAVALVSRTSGDTLFFAHVRNAHSAELISGEMIAVAASDSEMGDGDHVVFFDRHMSDRPVAQVGLKAAHGVVWDAKRHLLWALGNDTLIAMSVHGQAPKNFTVQVERTISLPGPIGHDLQIADDCSMLYVATTNAVFRFSPDQGRFEPFGPLVGTQNVKSLSINSLTGQIAYTRADSGVWWTYKIRLLNPSETIVLQAPIYKVRWYPMARSNE